MLRGKALTTSAPLVSDPHSMAMFATVDQELIGFVQLGSIKKLLSQGRLIERAFCLRHCELAHITYERRPEHWRHLFRLVGCYSGQEVWRTNHQCIRKQSRYRGRMKKGRLSRRCVIDRIPV